MTTAVLPRIIDAASHGAIPAAVAALRAGQLVAMPTETVYGLAADATNPRAVAGIFAAKGRPRFNPLIIHVASVAGARAIAMLTPEAERLAETFWPGPLTLVLPRRPGSAIADLAVAGLATVAVRVPAHPVARALLAAFGGPLAAPSANRSGHVSATTAAHVAADIGNAVAVIIDAGPAMIGLESTIVGLDGRHPTLLRAGGVNRIAIEAVLGVRLATPAIDPAAPLAPGHARVALRARRQASASTPHRSVRAKRSSPSARYRRTPPTPSQSRT